MVSVSLPQAFDHRLVRIAKQALAVTMVLIVALSVVTAARGLLGALQAPPTGFAPILSVVISLAFAVLFRTTWHFLYPNATALSRFVFRLGVPSACILCVVIAVTTSGIGVAASAVLWTFTVATELAWWYPTLREMKLPATGVETTTTRMSLPSEDNIVEEESVLDPSISQQVTRSTNGDGVELISGIVRAQFTVGERMHNLHIAFCPPLEYRPKVVVHQLDGVPVTVKVAQAEGFGARIELRLQEMAGESDSATVCFDVQPQL